LHQDEGLLLDPDSTPAFSWTDRIGSGRGVLSEWRRASFSRVMAKLVQRIQAEPFNLVGTLIFLGAIIHTFLASRFMLIAHRLEHQYHALKEQEKDSSDDKELSRMRIGTPRLNACTPCTTHSFSTSTISEIVAPWRNAALMCRRVPGAYMWV
jgi:hypothetical protein